MTFRTHEALVFVECGMLEGGWAASRAGAFLADLYGASGDCDPQDRTFTPAWLAPATAFAVRGAERELRASRVRLLGAKLDYEGAVATGTRLLEVLEGELAVRPYLIGSAATVADLSMYAYVARAPEGGVSLDPYPAVRAWLARVEALPGFIPMMAAPPPRAESS